MTKGNLAGTGEFTMAMLSGEMGAPAEDEPGINAGLLSTVEHLGLIAYPLLPWALEKYSLLLVPRERKGQVSLIVCRKDRSIRSSSEYRSQREKQKLQEKLQFLSSISRWITT